MKLELIVNSGVPKGEKITPYSMMPKVFCVIEGKRGKLFRNKEMLKHYFKYENALRRKDTIFEKEQTKVLSIFKTLTKKGPIFIQHNLVKG